MVSHVENTALQLLLLNGVMFCYTFPGLSHSLGELMVALTL